MSKTSFFICLVLLSVLPIASGQTAPHRPLPTEPLEKYDNPPAYIFRIETSPRMVSQYDTFTSYQVNVDAQGHNILGDAANETSIAVDPTNGNKMTIGWRQFNSVQSNFRQGGWGYTTDGGTSWTFPGVLENNVFRSDPVLNSNETGNFFYLSLLQTFCDDMWRSLNGGQSWTRLPPEGGGGGGDKEWFTIDKTNGMGHGFQYQAWSTAAACSGGQFSRSTDGGVTWMSPINIPNSPVWGTLDVDTNGNLFIGGGNFGSQFYCIRSSNAQNGNVTPTFDQVTTVNLGGSILFGAAINPGGLAGQIFLAVDRSGTITNNNIYMLASVRPTGANNGTDVMFVRSTNGGQTFSAPLRINDDPINHNKWHWFGTLSVAPNGRIDVVWLDTRNASNNTDSQLFYSYSTDGGNTWSANVAVSNPFNPFEGYPNQNKIGDYITIVSDNTGGNVAYSATFNFNPNTNQHEEDVYYVRVAPSAPMAQSAFSRKTHGAAGTFDVPLPLTGNVGVECRSGGATNDYQMIINFATSVTVGGASVTSGTGSVSSFSVSGSQVTVNLTGVTNVQRITVTLSNVNDGTHTGDVPVSMGVLVGDVNGNALVNASDVSLTKSQVGVPVSGSNFREDVNANGTISATDVALVKANVGTALPP
jgi:dockerin type I repeat protein